MKPLTSVINATQRTLGAMFPGFYADQKHNHQVDFGYPEVVSFNIAYATYRRNGLAQAAVEQTILETWQDYPQILESEKPTESVVEVSIRKHFEKLRIWQKIAETDRRMMVGEYSALILRLGDNKKFHEPVDRVTGGVEALIEVIPAWQGQLEVSSWSTDQESDNYGKPLMFNFNEAAVIDSKDKNPRTRTFNVHPDRVIVWSKDGTVYGRSMLEPGINALIDLEKISGSSGQGFWKIAKAAPVLTADKEFNVAEMAKALGVEPAEIADAMEKQLDSFNKNYDASLLLKGMTAETLDVNLPSPEHFFATSLSVFAASIPIPVKILIGSQTGERASTEDANAWSKTNNARRTNIQKPNIMALIQRLVDFGMLRDADWTINWTDLTESTMSEKIDRAGKMAEINSKQDLEPVFSAGEIRETVDMDPDLLPDRIDDGEDDVDDSADELEDETDAEE